MLGLCEILRALLIQQDPDATFVTRGGERTTASIFYALRQLLVALGVTCDISAASRRILLPWFESPPKHTSQRQRKGATRSASIALYSLLDPTPHYPGFKWCMKCKAITVHFGPVCLVRLPQRPLHSQLAFATHFAKTE
jgi:hypothetical protein